MEVPESVGTFRRQFHFVYEEVPVTLYRCAESGLRVAAAQVKSPTVHGYFTVHTEAFDDFGCPHTLEHLIFLGSERYPFKGVLDVLANRCLAQGTNAWTATDHTCYTVDTAGAEGFLRLLPVYLDHVLFPTLKDSGFVTEVHHITGEGVDAGVVYCEMQARENEAGDMTDRAMRLAAFPGKCGYKSETGGRLKELRELTNTTVRDYHKAYYRPDNFCVIVTGQVPLGELLAACAPTVETIRGSHFKSLSPMDRPFSAEVTRPEKQQEVRMEFPAEDESTGAICELCWHGPDWSDLESVVALKVLLAYLCEDSISPLRKALVESVPPLCGKISEGLHEYRTQLINITLKSCDVEQLSKRDVTAEVQAVFKGTAKAEGIDLPRLRSVIRQKQRQHLSAVESNPHDLFSGEIIGAFLYADDFAASSDSDGSSVRARLDAPGTLESLLAWPAERWAALCQRFLLSDTNPGVTVVGRPSKAIGEKIQGEDAARIEVQKKKLGDKGMKKAGKEVAAAEDENEVETPEEVSAEFKVPDVGKVQLIDVSTVTVKNGVAEAVFGSDALRLKETVAQAAAKGVPAMNFHLDHVAGAQFITCHIMVPLTSLSTRQLELLPLWCDTAFELPMVSSPLGEALSHEAVVQLLTDTVVHRSFGVGMGGGRFRAGQAANMLHVAMKVERAQYEKAPRLIARLLADVEFSVDRLRVAVKRMLNDVPNSKRNGKGLMRLAMSAFDYSDTSAHGAFNVFRVETLLKEMEDPEGVALGRVALELSELRKVLLAPGALAYISGDIAALETGIFTPWCHGPFMVAGNGGYAPAPATPLPALRRELYAADALRPPEGCTCGCLLSSTAEESNYWLVQCNSFTDPRSPELAPLLVAIEYITALEGPFWRKIRGKGHAYSYGINHDLEAGKLTFSLYKATNPVAAYEAAGAIIEQLCSEDGPMEDEGEDEDEEADEEADEEGLDPCALEAAQSGVLFGLIEPVDTVPGAMEESFAMTLQRSPPDQLQWLLRAVQGVTEDSVRSAMQKHIAPLFSGAAGRTVSMVCPSKKRAELEESLQKLDPPFKTVHLDVDSFVSTLAPASGFADLRRKVRPGA